MPAPSPKPRRRTPKQRRSRDTVDTLLEAAAQVFGRRGYAGATTNHVAERAGVSVGTLYQYFADKDALLEALLERHMTEGTALVAGHLVEAARAAAEGTLALEPLARDLAEAVLAFHDRAPRLHQVLFEEVPWPRDVRDQLTAMESLLAGHVAALLAAIPDPGRPHPDRAAWIVVQLVESLTHRYVLNPPPTLPRAGFVEEVVRLLCGYLGGLGPGAAAAGPGAGNAATGAAAPATPRPPG